MFHDTFKVKFLVNGAKSSFLSDESGNFIMPVVVCIMAVFKLNVQVSATKTLTPSRLNIMYHLQ